MADTRTVFPMRAREVTTWDAEADVVVAGFGCAGGSAAIAAVESGAEAMVLERAGGAGGASSMAGGLIYLGGGTALQKACGFDDTPEEMYKFLMAATAPDPDEAKIAEYCNGSVDHYNWLLDCGVPFKPEFYTGLLAEPESDAGLMYSGGEDAYPWSEIAVPAPRAHIPQLENKVFGERSGGWRLMQALIARASEVGVKVQNDTRVVRLVVDDDGVVCGVLATQYGEERFIRARRGVVLAAGGFVFNDEMLALHAPQLLGRWKIGTDGDDGRAIRIAQAVGAGIKHMEAAEAAYLVQSPLLVRSIVVNAAGQRFINEDGYFGRVGQAALFRQQGRTMVVFDEEGYESVPDDERYGIQPTTVCATIEELEAELEMTPGSLTTTIEQYNAHARNGEDPLFHKRSEFVRPLTPPVGVIDLRSTPPGVFTLGGLHTNPSAEVLDLDGTPIPGLFAAGRTTSGIPSWSYLSGSSLGDGTFFGRRAGRTAARRES